MNRRSSATSGRPGRGTLRQPRRIPEQDGRQVRPSAVATVILAGPGRRGGGRDIGGGPGPGSSRDGWKEHSIAAQQGGDSPPGAGIRFVQWRDITETRRTREALRASEERFRQVSSCMIDVAYSCARGAEGGYAIDWLAGAVTATLGYSEEEFLALGCWGQLVAAEDLPAIRAARVRTGSGRRGGVRTPPAARVGGGRLDGLVCPLPGGLQRRRPSLRGPARHHPAQAGRGRGADGCWRRRNCCSRRSTTGSRTTWARP